MNAMGTHRTGVLTGAGKEGERTDTGPKNMSERGPPEDRPHSHLLAAWERG
jgi:hypothetical protein